MKYFGTLKLQLKDNSQKRRRVIVMPLLLRWSFRPGLWTAPLRQHPATTTCGKRGFWNNVLLERESDRLDPSTSQPFASRSKLKQTLEPFPSWPYGSIAYKCPGDRIRPRKKCHFYFPNILARWQLWNLLAKLRFNTIYNPYPYRGGGRGGQNQPVEFHFFLLGNPGIVIQLLKWNFKVTFLDKPWALVRNTCA